jgi:hypothetical protein
MKNLVEVLRYFGIASGLKINWEKNVAYYSEANQTRPSWLGSFHWKWAQDEDISKLLGSPFGLGLKVGDIDKFLLNKVKEKLAFWCSTHLLLVGKALIVKSFFHFMVFRFYFGRVWETFTNSGIVM